MDAGPVVSGLHHARRPGSVEEARTLVAYNERIIETSHSPQRRHRSNQMLANLHPLLEKLERDETDRLRRIETAPPPVESFEGRVQRWRDEKDEEYETVWNGGAGLTSVGREG